MKGRSDQDRILNALDKHRRERHIIKAIYVHPTIKLNKESFYPYPVIEKNSIDGWHIELA